MENKCILENDIMLSIVMGDLILPDVSVLIQVFGKENLPKITPDENKLLKEKADLLLNREKLYDLLRESISNEEDISIFQKKLNLNNWETVFYTALLSKFGIETKHIPNNIKERELYSDIIKNNFYSYDRSENKETKNIRGMFKLLYKCKISTNCVFEYTLYPHIVDPICVFIPKYKLREWVKIEELSWYELCSNKNAIGMIKEEILKNPKIKKKLDWLSLCKNKSSDAMDIIKALYEKKPYTEKIYWKFLCENNSPGAMDIIRAEYEKQPDSKNIDWNYLCMYNTNSNAIDIIKEELKRMPDKEKTFFYHLCYNHSSEAMDMIKKEYTDNPNSEKINWYSLCENTSPGAMDIIKAVYEDNPNSEKITWRALCNNNSSTAMDIIKSVYENDPNSEKLYWHDLCRNETSGAMDIIRAEYEKDSDNKKIDWNALCMNKTSGAMDIIRAEYEKDSDNKKIVWYRLCKNDSPGAMDIIRAVYENDPKSDKIRHDWESLCENYNAIDILTKEFVRQNTSKNLEWHIICKNSNSVSLIERYLEKRPKGPDKDYNNKLFWKSMCSYFTSVDIIQKNINDPQKIYWKNLSENPIIFYPDRTYNNILLQLQTVR